MFQNTKKAFAVISMASCAAISFANAGAAGDWSYGGKTGPENWGNLSKEFSVCGTGKSQSPINLVASAKADASVLKVNYGTAPVTAKRVSEKVKNVISGQNSVTFGGDVYNLLQFHSHAPSEHAINGQLFPVTLHFVHQNAKGELLVVGVLVKEGKADHPELAKIVNNLGVQDVAKKEKTSLNLTGLVSGSTGYFHYMGSLTTPPCSENVKWFVVDAPIEASAAQINVIKSDTVETNRPLQALNERAVQHLQAGQAEDQKG